MSVLEIPCEDCKLTDVGSAANSEARLEEKDLQSERSGRNVGQLQEPSENPNKRKLTEILESVCIAVFTGDQL